MICVQKHLILLVAAGESHGTAEGAKFTSANNVTNGTDNEETTAALDVSTHESATAAIEVYQQCN